MNIIVEIAWAVTEQGMVAKKVMRWALKEVCQDLEHIGPPPVGPREKALKASNVELRAFLSKPINSQKPHNRKRIVEKTNFF